MKNKQTLLLMWKFNICVCWKIAGPSKKRNEKKEEKKDVVRSNLNKKKRKIRKKEKNMCWKFSGPNKKEKNKSLGRILKREKKDKKRMIYPVEKIMFCPTYTYCTRR